MQKCQSNSIVFVISVIIDFNRVYCECGGGCFDVDDVNSESGLLLFPLSVISLCDKEDNT